MHTKLLKAGAIAALVGFCGLSSGCAHTSVAHKAASPPPWPADAVFQAYPVIHCSSDETPASLLTDVKAHANDKSEETVKQVYTSTRDLVLTTLNLFLATGRWAGSRARITPTREVPRMGAPSECRMFELALADQITLRLPPSISGSEYIAPIAMVGYDYEPSTGPNSAPTISVRIAALLARGDGRVLRSLAVVARSQAAQLAPFYQERSSQEIAQDLTEQLARNLSGAIAE